LIYDRQSLVPGRSYSGPAVVTEYSATTIVPPAMTFTLTREDNLILEITRNRKGAPKRSALS
jgi:N-methylhydantoinase A/oxoprolinase/acetone carboxylase beta subunit